MTHLIAYSSIRFGLGRFTTEDEIDETIDVITKAIIKLRRKYLRPM
jgi:cysteine desulfurase